MYLPLVKRGGVNLAIYQSYLKDEFYNTQTGRNAFDQAPLAWKSNPAWEDITNLNVDS